MTDAQRRILEDFADPKLSEKTRRSARHEWETEREFIVQAEWLETGIAVAGCGHRITDVGRAALKNAQRMEEMRGPVLS